MTITFWCPDAPTKLITPYEDEPEFTDEVSTLPECNLANSNAIHVLRRIGSTVMPPEEYGTVEAVHVAQAIKDIQLAKTGVDLSAALERKIGSGLTHQAMARRVDCLLSVFTAARAHNFKVCWG